MSKIILDVNSKDIDTVLMILRNLKSGLISNISTDKKNLKKAVVEDELIRKSISTGKYMSRNAYKQKLSK